MSRDWVWASKLRRPMLAGCLALALPWCAAAQTRYADRADVVDFAKQVAQARGLNADRLRRQLAQARFNPQVVKLIMPPPASSPRDWAAYRSRFLDAPRIAAGLDFWRAHEPWLRQAEERWGVPASMVVAIIGVETFYGRVTGNFRVLDALATLSFDFPTGRRDRAPFFRAQLEEFLHWCERESLDVTSVMGSYAGAMGWPQFMPESIARWAVDFDEDGRIDLMKSPADIVGSVAHYFAAHGWQRDMPTHFEVVPPADVAAKAALLVPDIKPTFTVQHLLQEGAQFKSAEALKHEGPLALVELPNGLQAEPSYVAGTDNFYVVTRYNWSSFYAMSVIELARALDEARQLTAPKSLNTGQQISLSQASKRFDRLR